MDFASIPESNAEELPTKKKMPTILISNERAIR